MEKILYIDKKEFCDWYFDDKEDAYMVMEDLIIKEKISLKDYLCGLGYIPIDIVKNKEDINKKDIEDENIEDPDTNYQLKFAN